MKSSQNKWGVCIERIVLHRLFFIFEMFFVFNAKKIQVELVPIREAEKALRGRHVKASLVLKGFCSKLF